MDHPHQRELVALTSSTRAGLRAVVVLIAATACSEPEPDFVWRGEHLDIHGYGAEASDYCGGTFAHADAYMGAVASMFGYVGARPVLSIGPRDYVDDHCPDGVTGCAGDSYATVIEFALPLDHELVHVAQRGTIDCPPLIVEGLAEYTSWNYWDWRGDPGDIESTLDAWFSEETRYRDYSLLGHFMAFLIETRDLDQVLAVCELTGTAATLEQFAQAMEMVYGKPLADLLIEYQADYPVCAQRDFARKPVECGEPLAATLEVGQVVQVAYDIDCTNARTLGPRSSQGEADQVWVNHRVRLEPWLYPHVIHLRTLAQATEEPVAATVSFLPCGRCVDGIEGATLELPQGVSELPLPSLPAGDYVIEVRQPLAEARPLTLEIESIAD